MNIFIAEVRGEEAILTPEESWHCSKVLRRKAGDVIRVIDGAGNAYDCILETVSEKKCLARVNGPAEIQARRPYQLHLAIAPTKQIDRIEWMVEKAVETGVDEITFIQCQNSERVSIRDDRMRKIVESAVKQSLQAFIPAVHGLVPVRDFINAVQASQKLIAHCGPGERIPVSSIDFVNKSTCVLIGPEGDFSPAEISLAGSQGFVPVSLGASRLRTETAGLYVVTAAALLSEDK